MRTCRFCRAEYCVVDNEGSSDTEVCNLLVPEPDSYSYNLVGSSVELNVDIRFA
jgi:hypothetical protein